MKVTLQTSAAENSAHVDGGLSGVSHCADTGARTPIGVSGNFMTVVGMLRFFA